MMGNELEKKGSTFFLVGGVQKEVFPRRRREWINLLQHTSNGK